MVTKCGGLGSIRNQQKYDIQRPNAAATADAAGHIGERFITAGRRWGSPKSRGGREYFLFNQVQAEVSHIIEFQYDSLTKQIGPTWQLKLGSRAFEITAAYDVDEMRQVVRCECIEAR